jgi:hypothetical protein
VADLFGIPARRLPLAVLLVLVLAFTLSWLQGRFNQSDVKKGIAIALGHKPGGGKSVFDGLVALGRGDPHCDGKVVSTLLGDVDVRCSLPGDPSTLYEFRVLLDQKRPPRPASAEAEKLVAGLR